MANNIYNESADKFNTLSIRERILFGVTILAVAGLSWWHFFATPMMAKIEMLVVDNNRVTAEISTAQLSIQQIKVRLEAGVHKDKEDQLARLQQELVIIEEQLQLKASELVDPEEMFQLMSRLVYKESKLKLLSLKRREIKPAIEPKEGEESSDGIYRHVLEVKLSGKYEDILTYMTSLESLDWKLIWEEIEISRDDYPLINVKVVISTLSTRKEWVGV
ncbi:MAG: MSHA biogenesis protein MshJ [Polaribacter sp.]|jgi:MSHA biogenesis protein MshJ